MHFSAFLKASILVVAAKAQSGGSSTARGSPLATVSLTLEQESTAACLEACVPDNHVACTSKCIATAQPDKDHVNQTTECVAKCPQGDGSESETAEYARCTQECIGRFYFSSGGTPNPTRASVSSSAKVTEIIATVAPSRSGTVLIAIMSTMAHGSTTSSDAEFTSSPVASSTSAPRISSGAVAGIAIGATAAVILLLAGVVLFRRRAKSAGRDVQLNADQPELVIRQAQPPESHRTLEKSTMGSQIVRQYLVRK